MQTIEKIDMSAVLKAFVLKDVNFGSSTGRDNFGNTAENLIDSYSPVDGALIGKVSTTTKEEYENI